MSPLAHRIVKELTLPMKRRSFADRVGLLPLMDDIHCFECSAVIEAAGALGADINNNRRPLERFAFLPAPKTWIEWQPPNMRSEGGRIGCLLIENGDHADVLLAFAADGQFASSRALIELPLHGSSDLGSFRYAGEISEQQAFEYMAMLYALLAMINTPRVIGRTTHMPNSGLQRALAKARGMIGKFPHHAWTEVKLKVRPPVEEDGDEVIYLTGSRALHFVRQHLRIRRGQLELVTSHWRGDPSLGIKQSRYILVP